MHNTFLKTIHNLDPMISFLFFDIQKTLFSCSWNYFRIKKPNIFSFLSLFSKTWKWNNFKLQEPLHTLNIFYFFSLILSKIKKIKKKASYSFTSPQVINEKHFLIPWLHHAWVLKQKKKKRIRKKEGKRYKVWTLLARSVIIKTWVGLGIAKAYG